VALSVSRESSLIAPPTGAVNNRSAKAQIEALPVSSPTFSTASTQSRHSDCCLRPQNPDRNRHHRFSARGRKENSVRIWVKRLHALDQQH
jgi:hypothetical protein